MSFAYPLLLLVPLIYAAYRAIDRTPKPSASFPSFAILKRLPLGRRAKLRSPVLNGLSILTVTLFSLAAARPQRVTVIEQPAKARNIMLVLDVSKSMASPDFPASFGYTTRMEGAKQVVSEFIKSRSGDRLGLTIFGGHAYLQSPLTLDHNIIDELVGSIDAGMAGNGTAIGEGLGVALKRLKEIDSDSKAIILMTDGANNAGDVSPVKAAKVARDLGIKIHTIGIGSNGDPSGGSIIGGILTMGVQMAEYDEATLKEIADTTGGVYFNANSLSGLKDVYEQIGKLTEQEQSAPKRKIVHELFYYFSASGLAAFIVWCLLAFGAFLKVP